ncbi:MAG: sulfur carrier protein ThiS adenylyltransferase ThiF [Pseudomonadota bacterium]
MDERPIEIMVNEKHRTVERGTTVGDLRDLVEPGADVLVVNGYPSGTADKLNEGDKVVLIRRGAIPGKDELEVLMAARHTPHVHDRMKRSVAGVAGLGGLGSNVAVYLARMGVGKLILADFDVVEPTNLNRQHYAVDHIGMAKTAAMGSIIAAINPYIEVVLHQTALDRDNIPEVFREAQVIVECFDGAQAKAMILATVAELLPDAYIIGASGLAGYGESNKIQTMQLGERVFMVGDLTTDARPGRGLMAPRVAIAAGHQANMAVEILMNMVQREE